MVVLSCSVLFSTLILFRLLLRTATQLVLDTMLAKLHYINTINSNTVQCNIAQYKQSNAMQCHATQYIFAIEKGINRAHFIHTL